MIVNISLVRSNSLLFKCNRVTLLLPLSAATKASSTSDLPEYGPFEIKKLPRQNSIVKDTIAFNASQTEEVDNLPLSQR